MRIIGLVCALYLKLIGAKMGAGARNMMIFNGEIAKYKLTKWGYWKQIIRAISCLHCWVDKDYKIKQYRYCNKCGLIKVDYLRGI